FRTDHRTTGVQRDLHPVAMIRLPGVELLGHLDVEADHLAVEFLDLVQFLGHVLTEPLGHLGLAALDDDVHAELRSRTTPCDQERALCGGRAGCQSRSALHRLPLRLPGLSGYHEAAAFTSSCPLREDQHSRCALPSPRT